MAESVLDEATCRKTVVASFVPRTNSSVDTRIMVSVRRSVMTLDEIIEGMSEVLRIAISEGMSK